MYPYYCGISICMLITNLLRFMQNPEKTEIMELSLATLDTTLKCLVWFIGRRYLKFYMLMIIVQYIVNVFIIIVYCVYVSTLTDIDPQIVYQYQGFYRVGTCIVSCMLLSPSFSITVVYVVGCYVNTLWISWLWNEFSSAEQQMSSSFWFVFGSSGFMFFFILQKRELKRFMQTQKAYKREQ